MSGRNWLFAVWLLAVMLFGAAIQTAVLTAFGELTGHYWAVAAFLAVLALTMVPLCGWASKRLPRPIQGFCVACGYSRLFPSMDECRPHMFAHTTNCPDHPICRAYRMIEDMETEIERLNTALNRNVGAGV